MDLPPIPLGWIKPALKVAAALSMAVAFVPSAISSERPQPHPLLEGSTQTEKSTQFVPEGHKGMVCMAIAPQCMTKKQWAAYCLSQSDLRESKSCRDALGQPDPNPGDH